MTGAGSFSKSDSHLGIADALRALAILAVLVNHLFGFARVRVGGDHHVDLALLGIWGVNVFFVLSGFLLAKSFLGSILEDRPFPSVSKFLVRRALRIYPLYFVAVLASIATVALLLLRPMSLEIALPFFLMVQATTLAPHLGVNNPLWTMGVDAAFYLVLGPYMWAIYAMTRRRSLRSKVALILGSLAAIVAASLAYRYYESVEHVTQLHDFFAVAVYVRSPLGMAAAFALGIAVALTVALVPRDRLPRAAYAAFVLAGAALALGELLVLHEIDSAGPGVRAVLRVTFLDAPAALSAALILFGLIQGGVPPLTRVARAGAVASFATLAYAVYLFHYPILETIELRVLHGATGGAILVELAGFAVVVVLPIALVAHLFIEKPFLNLKERLRAPAPFSAAPHFLGEPRAADR